VEQVGERRVRAYWDEFRKSVFWNGYNPGGTTLSIFEVRNGEQFYHEVSGLPVVSVGGTNAHHLVPILTTST
jgi:hypothetical protein